MRADPVRQGLGRGRLDVGVVGGTEHGDEELRRRDLAGSDVDHRDGLAGVVNKEALARGMSLAHRR